MAAIDKYGVLPFKIVVTSDIVVPSHLISVYGTLDDAPAHERDVHLISP
jgi:hypothetical protein